MESVSSLVELKKEIGIIGLGKMGGNLALNLKDKNWKVVGYNRTSSVVDEFTKQGVEGSYSIEELVYKLSAPRIVWIMLPHGDPVTKAAEELYKYLDKGDLVIDGGNSRYGNSIELEKLFAEKSVNFLDVGVSGGPEGARKGACMMIGGSKDVFLKYESLFKDLCVDKGYGYFGKSGSGHFVKMIHNGIEYGMMQSISEGFDILKNSPDFPEIDVQEAAEVFNHGSVIESRLMAWLKEGYEKFGNELDTVSGTARLSGEGEWTVKYALEKGIKAESIMLAVEKREETFKKPTYQGRIITVLRNMFGGHSIEE